MKRCPYSLRILALTIAGACIAAAPVTEITVHGNRPFPESVTSTADGTIITGSAGQHIIFRAAPGSATAEPWIRPDTHSLPNVLGVLADEEAQTLWACVTDVSGNGASALQSFDLATGAPSGSYPFPGDKSLCNDIAVGPDGTAYVTDTVNPRILRLKPGAKALEVWTTDDRFDSLDGIAFGDNNTLYVNTVRTGHLFRIRLERDGSAGKAIQLELSAKLVNPDGMRSNGVNQLLLVEGAGRLDHVSFDGDTAKIEVLKDGFTGSTAVTRVGDTAWVVEAKLNYLTDPKLKDQDPGPAKIYAVRLRGNR